VLGSSVLMSSRGSLKHGHVFFLSGYYGQGNLGDDLLLRATIEGICRICPAKHFIVRNEGDVAGLNGLPVSVELTGIDKVAADQTKSKFRRFIATLLAYRQYLMRCDWFVFGGGTVFHERSSVIPLAMTLAICVLARLMGVRIAALGAGVATLQSRTGAFLLRHIIELSDVFAVRDDAAFAECVKSGAAHKVVLTADLVFTMTGSLQRVRGVSSRKEVPLVGISIYAPAFLDPVSGNDTLAAMREVLEIIVARGWRVALLAFHHRPKASMARLDNDVLKKMVEGIPNKFQEQVILTALNADDMDGIARIFSDMDVHCGMRFHGLVLSAIFEKPFVGVVVDNKIDAISRLFEMPQIRLTQLSAKGLIDAVDLAMERHIDRATLAKCAEDSEQNFSQFAACVAAA